MSKRSAGSRARKSRTRSGEIGPPTSLAGVGVVDEAGGTAAGSGRPSVPAGAPGLSTGASTMGGGVPDELSDRTT